MASGHTQFKVYWTAQLTKKHKVWESGVLRWNAANNHFSLLNEEQERSLTDGFITGLPVIGREYHIGGHLIEIVSLHDPSQDNRPSIATVPSVNTSQRISTRYKSPPPAKRRILHTVDAEQDEPISAKPIAPSAPTPPSLMKNRPLTRLPFKPPTRSESKPPTLDSEEPEELYLPEPAKPSNYTFPSLPSLPVLPSAPPPQTQISQNPSNYIMMDWRIFEKPLEQQQLPPRAEPPPSFGQGESRFGSSTTTEAHSFGATTETPSDFDWLENSQMDATPSRVKTFDTSGNVIGLSDIIPSKPPPPLPPRLPGTTLSAARKDPPRLPVNSSPFSTSTSTSNTRSNNNSSQVAPIPVPSLAKTPTPAAKQPNKTAAPASSRAPPSSPIAANTSGSFKAPTAVPAHAQLLGFGTKTLNFPSKQIIATLPKVPRRSITISTSFTSMNDYKQQFSEALFEDLNHGILPIATKFREAYRKHSKGQEHLSETSKRSITSSFKQVYFDIDLISYSSGPSKKRKFSDSTASAAPSAPLAPQFYIKLPVDSQSQEASSAFQKDDLWLISSTPNFEPSNSRDFIFFARSTLPGKPSSVMELKPITEGAFGSKMHLPLPKIDGEVPAHAIHVMSMSSDISMLDALSEISQDNMPLFPFVMNRNTQLSKRPTLDGSLSNSVIQAALQECVDSHPLNDDQLDVFKKAALWFDKSQQKNNTTSPFILVHGVFGSGKSHMLVMLIMFICDLFEKMESQQTDEEARKLRILVSAATNTAVDRILVGLLDEGFQDFVRVGSLKRINSRILPFSIHREKRSGGKNADDFELSSSKSTSTGDKAADWLALKDLDELLRSKTLSSTERALIEQQKLEIQNGSFERKLGLVESATVVGATCIATTFPILKTSQFDIVILDECSQIPEPLSLLPTSRFRSSAFVLVGDPLQLPPQLRTKPKSDDQETEGLGNAMFSRLTQLGYSSTLLRTQYRLHPKLSAIPNGLFYGGRLLDGVTAESRAPLHPQLPTLVFVDNEDTFERVSQGGSIENAGEGNIVTTILQQLVSKCGIEGDKIGVICLYKAQVALVQDLITRACQHPQLEHLRDDLSLVQVSTVDAFQGAEKDIIVLSTCRTESRDGFSGNTGGFIDSPFRMNVSLSRARRHLIIVGSAPTLLSSPRWKPVLTAAKSCGSRSYISGHSVLHGDYFAFPEERER